MNTQLLPQNRGCNDLSRTIYAPARIVKIDLQDPLTGISAFDENNRLYLRALCFVYLHLQPLGAVEFIFDEEGVDAQTCAQQIWQRLHVQINDHLRQDGLPLVTGLGVEGLPPASMPRCLAEY